MNCSDKVAEALPHERDFVLAGVFKSSSCLDVVGVRLESCLSSCQTLVGCDQGLAEPEVQLRVSDRMSTLVEMAYCDCHNKHNQNNDVRVAVRAVQLVTSRWPHINVRAKLLVPDIRALC